MQIKRSGKCVIVFKTRCLEALQNKSCWPQRKPLMNAVQTNSKIIFFTFLCITVVHLPSWMSLFILWGRGKSDRSLWILLALLCFALVFSSSSAWLCVKIEGPPPNYVLLLQICSHFPKVSYTWTSLLTVLTVLWNTQCSCYCGCWGSCCMLQNKRTLQCHFNIKKVGPLVANARNMIHIPHQVFIWVFISEAQGAKSHKNQSPLSLQIWKHVFSLPGNDKIIHLYLPLGVCTMKYS